MKTNHWWKVWGVVGCVACSGSQPSNPAMTGPDTRAAAVGEAAYADCDTATRCEQIGPDKAYASDQDCLTSRSSFWSDHWAVADCEGKIAPAKVQTCLDALEAINCDSLIDQLKVINTQCATTEVCSGDQ